MSNISLCIYTNCTIHNSTNANLLFKTLSSFISTFGLSEINKIWIFIDSNPLVENYELYKESIEKCMLHIQFPFEIIKTKSLSDGYLQSIKLCQTKYIFQLEHDWEFISDNINHTLNEITFTMDKLRLYHLRFNRRQNLENGWNFTIKQLKNDLDVKVCQVTNLSNNPHIIDKDIYISDGFLDIIKLKSGADGIEEEFFLTDKKGHVYGRLGHLPTIKHIDGRSMLNF